jgi:ABC-type amino acid transport substrate-binding protein
VAGLKVSDPISVVPTFPIVNRDETELVKAIDEGLKTLREDGTLSALSVDVFGSDLFSLAGK